MSVLDLLTFYLLYAATSLYMLLMQKNMIGLSGVKTNLLESRFGGWINHVWGAICCSPPWCEFNSFKNGSDNTRKTRIGLFMDYPVCRAVLMASPASQLVRQYQVRHQVRLILSCLQLYVHSSASLCIFLGKTQRTFFSFASNEEILAKRTAVTCSVITAPKVNRFG